MQGGASAGERRKEGRELAAAGGRLSLPGLQFAQVDWVFGDRIALESAVAALQHGPTRPIDRQLAVRAWPWVSVAAHQLRSAMDLHRAQQALSPDQIHRLLTSISSNAYDLAVALNRLEGAHQTRVDSDDQGLSSIVAKLRSAQLPSADAATLLGVEGGFAMISFMSTLDALSKQAARLQLEVPQGSVRKQWPGLLRFVKTMNAVWIVVHGRSGSASRVEGRSGSASPFVRACVDVARHVGLELTPSQIGYALRKA